MCLYAHNFSTCVFEKDMCYENNFVDCGKNFKFEYINT